MAFALPHGRLVGRPHITPQWGSPNLPTNLIENNVVFHRSSSYRPLRVLHQGLSRKAPAGFNTFPLRMNLVAASKRSADIYIAHGDHFVVLDTPAGHGVCDPKQYKYQATRPFEDDNTEGYIDANFPYAITNMHVGEIGDEEVLVTSDDSGHSAVYFTNSLSTQSPLLLKLPMSAWGMDTHASKRLLAVSCNAHIVTLFHLGMGIDGWEWTTLAPESPETFPKIVLRHHIDNIPCVAFDQSGNYIASGSLDRSVVLWDCKTGHLMRRISTSKSVWAIRFLNKSDFKHYQRTDEEINEANRQQKRGFRFPNLMNRARYSPSSSTSPTQQSPPERREPARVPTPVPDMDSDNDIDPEMDYDNDDIIELLPTELLPPEPYFHEATASAIANETITSNEILTSQLLLFTDGPTLVMRDFAREGDAIDTVRRGLGTDWMYHISENFWMLDTVPSMSMVFVSSANRTAWLLRMVYFPDLDFYDLIAEYKFPDRLRLVDNGRTGRWPRAVVPTCGSVVQALCLDDAKDTENVASDDTVSDERGIMAGPMGVKIVMVSSDGVICWWTVKREDDEQVGIEDIIL